MTYIVSVANPKGGVGKSTLTMQLAGAFARRGLRVRIADADAQGTASNWASANESPEGFFASVSNIAAHKEKAHLELRKWMGETEIVIVDCPAGFDTLISQSVLLVSDLAVVPVRPSPTDLIASVAVMRLLDTVKIGNPTLGVLLVANQVETRTSIGRDCLAEIRKLGPAVASTEIGRRAVYMEAMAVGDSVHGLKGAGRNAAVDEIERLATEVFALLGERQLETTQ